MATRTKKSEKRRRVKRTLRRSKNRFIGKPSGKIQERVHLSGRLRIEFALNFDRGLLDGVFVSP